MIKQIKLKDLPKETYITFGKLIYDSKGNLVDIKESRELLIEIIQNFTRLSKNVKSVCKELRIPRTLIPKILNYKRKIRLEYLLKILDFLEKNKLQKYTIGYLEKHIYAISSLHGRDLKPFIKINGKIERKFPFNFNTIEGIKCLTVPLSDGYILKSDDEYIRAGYTNSDIALHEDLIKNMRATFGDISYSQRKIRAAYETYFIGLLGKIYVECLGFKIGNKVKNDVSFPACLKSLENPNLIGALVSQFIDDEGHFANDTIDICIVVDKDIPISNNFDRQAYAPNLLKDIKKLLDKINVNSHFRQPHHYMDKRQNKIKWTYHLQINGFSNIKNLYLYLNIIKDVKRRRIQNYLNRLQEMYNKLNYFNDRLFQVSDITFLFRISRQSAENYIRTFQRANLIKLIEKGKYICKNGAVSYEKAKYKLV